MSTPIEKILPREALQHIRPRSAATQVEDAKRELSQTKAQLHVERGHHKQTREERDMAARQLAVRAHQNGELRMMVAKAITVLGRHKEHADCRQLSAELADRMEQL